MKSLLIKTIKENTGKLSAKQIGDMLNYAESSVRSVASELGISLEIVKNEPNRVACRNKILTEGWKYTAYQLAKEFSLPPSTVHNYAWRMGVKLKHHDTGTIIKPKIKSRFFREHEMENWLIN